MYKIRKEQLSALLETVGRNMDLYLPVSSNGKTNFGIWTEDAKVDLETLKTVKSPKDAFFPQSEVLYSCYKDAKKIEITPQELVNQDFVIFGVRPCDVRGFEVLDRVFLAEPVDTYYAARRKHGIVVSLACHEPEESCFCKVFDIDAAAPEGDVAMWAVDDVYCMEARTEKGEKFLDLVKEHLEPAVDEDGARVSAEQEAIREIIEKLPYSHLSLKDFNTGHGVQRYRCWDSCMYSDFTLMAHGNNRTTQMQRFRQRFMHKLVYYPANNDGMYSCVGCGRCVEKCPQGLNIVKVIKRMGGSK